MGPRTEVQDEVQKKAGSNSTEPTGVTDGGTQSGSSTGPDYVALMATAVLGVVSCFALYFGYDQIALAASSGIVGYMARLYHT